MKLILLIALMVTSSSYAAVTSSVKDDGVAGTAGNDNLTLVGNDNDIDINTISEGLVKENCVVSSIVVKNGIAGTAAGNNMTVSGSKNKVTMPSSPSESNCNGINMYVFQFRNDYINSS